MDKKFRSSYFLDFNTGRVWSRPMDGKPEIPEGWRSDELHILWFFRVIDVWFFGPAIEVLKQNELGHGLNCTWSHSGFSVLAMVTSYFEMIGKTINPKSEADHTSQDNFRYGFRDVYNNLPGFTDEQIDVVCDRLRNGLYHISTVKPGLKIGHAPGETLDCRVQTVVDKEGNDYREVYIDPHLMVRTMLNHFPWFIERVRQPPYNDYTHMPGNFTQFIESNHSKIPGIQERRSRKKDRMVHLLVFYCPKKGPPTGGSQEQFRSPPRIGEYIEMRDANGVEQIYKVRALIHPLKPDKTSGELYLIHVGPKYEFRKSLV